MTRNTTLQAILAFLIFVPGSLQAWDSNVPAAGLLIVLLVSLAIPATQQYMVGALVLAFILLLLARLLSPIPSPELFTILVPAAMGLIFARIVKQEA